jgi:hypothetical protein
MATSTTHLEKTTRGTEAPADYTELFEQYWDMVCGLVRKAGIADYEDAASEILMKFIERDFLSKFEADKTFTLPNGATKTTKFSTFLAGFVSKYVLQCRDRQFTRATKEPVHLEQPVGEDATWIEVFASTHLTDETFIDVDYAALVTETREYLASLPIRGTRDLALVFSMCVEMLYMDGRIDRKVIAEKLNVSDTAVSLIFKDLREALKDAGLR